MTSSSSWTKMGLYSDWSLGLNTHWLRSIFNIKRGDSKILPTLSAGWFVICAIWSPLKARLCSQRCCMTFSRAVLLFNWTKRLLAVSLLIFASCHMAYSSWIQASMSRMRSLVCARVSSNVELSSWNFGIISWRMKLRWYFVDSFDESSRQAKCFSTTRSNICSWFANNIGRIMWPFFNGIPWNPANPLPRVKFIKTVSALSIWWCAVAMYWYPSCWRISSNQL